MYRDRLFSLPLLSKELLDLSGRRRTYLVRMLYAAGLMLTSYLVLYNQVPSGTLSATDVLGCGTAVMLGIGYAQQIGLQLVLPAVTCGVFTVEKERNTLGLLFLTKLGPWTILFEKFFSRLLLAWCFVLISAPVLAFSYGLGGFTIDLVVAQVLGLLVSSFTIVSISILCSAYFRTTTAALLASYLIVFISRVILQAGVYAPLMGVVIEPEALLRSTILLGGISVDDSPYPAFGFSPLYSTVLLSVPWLLLSLTCLRLARRFLVTRAFLAPQNPLRLIFQWLDRLFEIVNRNPVTRGVIVIRPAERVPDLEPVAWRETTTRSLGQVRYLIRILILLEVPTLFLLCSTTLNPIEARATGLVSILQGALWAGLTLFICVLSAGLIASERARQTLDPLLTTPMAAREIVRQKMAGVMRLIWICQLPLWTCLWFRYIVEPNTFYLLCQASMLLIYPRLVAWIGMSHGLRSKSAMAAVIKSLLDILARCLGPLAIIGLAAACNPFEYHQDLEELFEALALVSPLTLLVICEQTYDNGYRDNSHIPVALLLNTAFHAWMLNWVSSRCLNRASVMLGRSKVPAVPKD